MTKQVGLGDNLYLAGVDLSGNASALQGIQTKRNLLEVPTIDKSAMSRIIGMRDGGLSFNSWFDDNDAANRAAGAGSPFVQLSSLPSADVIVTYFRGTVLGGEVAALTGKQVDYIPNRGADGALAFTTQVQANSYGLEWGQSLTPGRRVDVAPTSPASGVDMVDVSTAFGAAAYLHVFAFTGTNVTFRVQDSADNIAFANITGLNAFTVVTAAPASERIETDLLTRTIRRYARVITTGTFTSVDFAVAFVRYRAANREQ